MKLSINQFCSRSHVHILWPDKNQSLLVSRRKSIFVKTYFKKTFNCTF